MPRLNPQAGLQLAAAVGHTFSEIELLEQAMTHSTYAYEHRSERLVDNERLEYLGDAVLDLVVSDVLFQDPAMLSEGPMTKTRALIVCENTLAMVARKLGLGQLLLLGKGETATGGRDKPSNLANATEALFGAIYLDAGYDKARTVVLSLLDEYLQQALAGDMVYDYKSRLLELIQGTRGNSTLRFAIIDERGPVHERTFTAAVIVDDRQIATGSGGSKKEAEQKAARLALSLLTCNRKGCQVEERTRTED